MDELSESCAGRRGDAKGVCKWYSESDHEFENRLREFLRLMCHEELLTLVLHPDVESFNNEAKRSLRRDDLEEIASCGSYVLIFDYRGYRGEQFVPFSESRGGAVALSLWS